MEVSARTGGRKAARKAAAQQRARRRRMQRIALIVGLAVVAIGITAAVLMRQVGSGSEGDSGQAIYQFDTNDYHSLAFEPQDPDTLYFGHHGGLMVSQDGGETWDDARLSGVDVMQQAIPSDDSGRRYAAGHNVFSVSTDSGETWAAPSTNLPGLDLHGFAAAPTDGNRLYTFEVTSAGFYTSADGGSTWESLPLPPGMQSGMLPLAVGYDDPTHVFAAVGNQILESRDGGANWVQTQGPGGTLTSIATHPQDPNVLLAGTGSGLFQRGPDGSWTNLPVQLDGSVLALVIHPEDPSRIAVIDQNGKLYRSDDGGTTWGEG